MSARKSVYRVKREAAETLPSPNATVPQITVELRVFYPPHMGNEKRAAQMVRQLSHEVVLELGQAVAGETPCPDHGTEATMLGILGDSYCMASGCDWWDMPLPESGPIIHDSGCGWETGPYCTCGKDPGRMHDEED